MFTWQWWVCQSFVLIALVLVVISTQQRTALKLNIYKGISTFFSFIGLCFLGQPSAIILNGVGVLRSIMVIAFGIKPNVNKRLKYSLVSALLALLVILNIVFWQSFYNLLSIIIAGTLIITYIQRDAKTIRTMVCGVSIVSAIYYTLIQSPMNAIIDLIGFMSSIVGIFRIDMKSSVCGCQKETEATIHDSNADGVEDNPALNDIYDDTHTEEDINQDTDYYGGN